MPSRSFPRLNELPTYDEDEPDQLNVIVETPQGSPQQFDYDAKLGLFRLGMVMPHGNVFPFDVGFAPSTLAEDGSPLGILMLMDAPVFPGCLVSARLVGVIEAEQTQEKVTTRNDRLLAVAVQSRRHRDVREPGDLPGALLEEVEHFFRSYNELAGKQFKVLGRAGSVRAHALVKAGEKRFAKP